MLKGKNRYFAGAAACRPLFYINIWKILLTMNDNVKNELNRIVNALADTGIVSQIFLFGSYACGEETSDSDIDLCVLTSVKDKRPIELMSNFRLKLLGVKTMPLDLIAFNQDEFYSNAKRPTSFHHQIAEKGVLLYEH